MLNYLRRHWPKLLIGAIFLVALKILLWPCNDYQGWGGDYAGYLSQARKIVNGHPTDETNYIYNPALPYLAPPAYPMGFPLILAPIYAVVGLDLVAFIKFETVTWWLLGLVLFFMLRKHFSMAVATVASLLFLFNPYFFAGKSVILPDYLFACWLLLSAYWYVHKDRSKVSNALICGILAGMAWITRANGVVLFAALCADVMMEHIVVWRRQKRISVVGSDVKFLAIVIGVAAGIQFLVHGILFPLPKTGSYFDQLMYGESMLNTLRTNLDTNLVIIINYFQLEPEMAFGIKNTDIAARIGGAIAMGFSILGLLVSGGRAFRFYRILLAALFAVVVIWPMAQAIRYLVPALPLLIFFCAAGVQNFKVEGRWSNYAKWAIIPLLLYGAYYNLNEKIGPRNLAEEVGGPHVKVNQEAFQYVRDSLPTDVRIAFHQPLILDLYAERRGFLWNRDENKLIEEELARYKIGYLLVNHWVMEYDGKLKKYLQTEPPALKKIWGNERNTLYQIQLKDQLPLEVEHSK